VKTHVSRLVVKMLKHTVKSKKGKLITVKRTVVVCAIVAATPTWFASAQPRIDWAKGWIDYTQLPIVLKSNDVDRAIFSTRTKGRKAVIKTIKVDEQIPHQYRAFSDVFSDEESKKLPPSRPWDHKIELKPGAPPTLISHMIKLSAAEQQELRKFMDEHLERGTIRRSKSP